MFIFLIAEVTAVSLLVNYISGTSLWITSLIVIVSSLTYTLYGGLRASIFTDKIQFIVFLLISEIIYFFVFISSIVLLILSLFKKENFSIFSSLKENNFDCISFPEASIKFKFMVQYSLGINNSI